MANQKEEIETEDILSPLNDRQKEAVCTTEGPVLIIAGAGSGKTRALTHRVAYLMLRGIPPENILAVTFTNKAAGEMAARIRELISNSSLLTSTLPFIGTFHSFCAKILRLEAHKLGYTKHFTILDDDDSLSLLKEIMKELNVPAKQFPPAMIMNIISGLKSELVGTDDYEGKSSDEAFPQTVYRVYDQYEKRLRESNAFDFDNLIMKTVELFRNNPSVLKKYQNRFRYIHVDEYQDTNTAQYELTRLLAGASRNLFVIGDDAQSIYSWRNADFRNILNFERDWPDAKVIVLDENYRSTQNILSGANAVIAHNRLQKPKNLWTKNQKGGRIEYVVLPSEREEAEFIVSHIASLLKEGGSLGDVAVLYRTNAQSRAIEEALLEQSIPYRIIGGTKFYKRKEVKDILAYLRLIQNPADLLALKRVINVPARGIGKMAFLRYSARIGTGQEMSRSVGTESARERDSVEKFETLMSELRGRLSQTPLPLLIKELIKKIRYEEYLEESFPDSDSRIENIRELAGLSRRFEDEHPADALSRMLEEASLMSAQDEMTERKDILHLMTLHAAKGLEFSFVFVTGVEEGIFPHAKSLFDAVQLEEERRLCYVGITRSKERLWLLRARRRMLWGSVQANPESRFLKEIPKELLNVTNLAGDDFFGEDEDEELYVDE